MATTWLKCANNAVTTLSENLTAGATTMWVVSETTLPSSFPYRTTIWNAATYGSDNPAADPNMEIVEITGRADYYGGSDYDYGNVLTIIRGRENTTGKAHNSGDTVALLVTAGIIQQIQDAITALE